MSEKKVSIIIPVYNAEATLKRCLDSVCDQSYPNLEILLINDGSSDSSLEICRIYSQKDSRIVLHTQENAGPSAARNKAIDMATGDYLAFVDADDYIERDMFERMVTTAEETAVDMVICSFFEENGKTVRPRCFSQRSGYYNQEECFAIGLSVINYNTNTDIPPYSWIRMVRRDIFDDPKLRYDARIKRSEDFLLWTQVHFCIKSMFLMDAHLYHYVNNPVSITRSYVPDYWMMCKLLYTELNEQLPKNREIEKKLQAMLIQKSMSALFNAKRAGKMQFETQMREILNDKDLIRAAREVGMVKNSKRGKIYALLVILRLKFLIRYIFLK